MKKSSYQKMMDSRCRVGEPGGGSCGVKKPCPLHSGAPLTAILIDSSLSKVQVTLVPFKEKWMANLDLCEMFSALMSGACAVSDLPRRADIVRTIKDDSTMMCSVGMAFMKYYYGVECNFNVAISIGWRLS